MPALEGILGRLLGQRIGPGEPGAVIGVYSRGNLLASAAAGLADVDRSAPLTPHTPIEIASVSKQLGAATIVSMSRDGLLDLDDDITELVPELRFEGITLRHCLQHTSGLPDYLTLGEMFGLPIGLIIGYEAFLDLLPTMTQLQFLTGTDVSYSNTGYVVAAIAAERAGKATFPELVADRIFRRLGMSHSLVRTCFGQITPGMAVSYAPNPAGGFAPEDMGAADATAGARHTVGDGEILTTIEDLAAWHGFLWDGRELGADIRDLLIAPSRLADGRPTTYGLGIRHMRVGGIDAFGHSGSIWGYRAKVLVEPLSGTGVTVLGNRADLNPADLAWRTLRAVMDDVPVSGPWYSTDAVRELNVSLRADGGADIDSDGESWRLDRTDPASWQEPTAEVALRLESGTAVLTDAMGREITFHPVDTAGAPPPVDDLVGTWHDGPHRELTIAPGPDGAGLELARGAFPRCAVVFVATVSGVDLYRAEGAVLALVRAPGASAQLTLSAGSVLVRGLTRAP